MDINTPLSPYYIDHYSHEQEDNDDNFMGTRDDLHGMFSRHTSDHEFMINEDDIADFSV